MKPELRLVKKRPSGINTYEVLNWPKVQHKKGDEPVFQRILKREKP